MVIDFKTMIEIETLCTREYIFGSGDFFRIWGDGLVLSRLDGKGYSVYYINRLELSRLW